MRALPNLVVSQLVRVEVPSALWRKLRDGVLSDEHARDLVAAFEADYFGADEESRLVVVALVADVLEEAAERCHEGALRALDAIQLASALLARNADEECASFACFDEQLRAAAEAEGFDLIPMFLD